MTDAKHSDIAMAFARESGSAARNRLYAARFKKEGKMALVGLLNAIAESEEIQARRAFMHLRGKIDNPSEYISALKKSKFEAYSRLYPGMSSKLYNAGQKTTAEAFEQFGEVAKVHLDHLDAVKDEIESRSPRFVVCRVCGYIAADDPPSRCPVCGAVQVKFRPVE
jgi:rubrerythrin